MVRKKKVVRHCSVCGRTGHDARRHRKNPQFFTDKAGKRHPVRTPYYTGKPGGRQRTLADMVASSSLEGAYSYVKAGERIPKVSVGYDYRDHNSGRPWRIVTSRGRMLGEPAGFGPSPPKRPHTFTGHGGKYVFATREQAQKFADAWNRRRTRSKVRAI